MDPMPRQADVLANRSIYGDPRRRGDAANPSPAWMAANLIILPLPFICRFDGTPVRGARLHKAAAPHFARFYDLVWEAAGRRQATIDQWGMSVFGGGFNYRLMRGGAALSMHSYGCAVDHDPARNGLGDATPRFLEFPELVRAIRASGLCWGADWNGDGKTADTRTWDGMHFQATQPIG